MIDQVNPLESADGADIQSLLRTEVSGKFERRGAVIQQARFAIDEVLAKGNHYEHRLMDYNNDPKTTCRSFSLLSRTESKTGPLLSPVISPRAQQ